MQICGYWNIGSKWSIGIYSYRSERFSHFFKCVWDLPRIFDNTQLLLDRFWQSKTCWEAEKLFYPVLAISAISAYQQRPILAYQHRYGIGPFLDHTEVSSEVSSFKITLETSAAAGACSSASTSTSAFNSSNCNSRNSTSLHLTLATFFRVAHIPNELRQNSD